MVACRKKIGNPGEALTYRTRCSGPTKCGTVRAKGEERHVRNQIYSLMTLAILVVGTVAVTAAEDDHAAIEATVRDYVDGWYAGDAERMERALHPDLAKRSMRTLPNGSEYLDTASASNMVAYTTMGFSKGKLPEGYVNQVTILETTEKMAMAKSIAPEFIDYIHLAKTTEGWKIVNVLWEPVEK